MDKIWYFEQVNLFKILCPTKFGNYENKHVIKPIIMNELDSEGLLQFKRKEFFLPDFIKKRSPIELLLTRLSGI